MAICISLITIPPTVLAPMRTQNSGHRFDQLKPIYTGGSLYNNAICGGGSEVVSSGSRHAAPLIEKIEVSPVEVIPLVQRLNKMPDRHVIFDSIFWLEISHLSSLFSITSRCIRSTLLVHYLPSTNPQLSVNESKEWKSIEKKALHNVSHVMTVGRKIGCFLKANYDLNAVDVCLPGYELPSAGLGNQSRMERSPALKLVTVANVLGSKGYMELLAGLERASEKGLSWEWKIVGSTRVDTDFYEKFVEKIRLSGLEDQVEICGSLDRDEQGAIYDWADVFLFGSHYESFGIVLGEALLHGVIVISPDVGDASYILQGHGHGRLLKSLDPDEIAGAVCNLIACRQWRSPPLANTHSNSKQMDSHGLKLSERRWTEVRREFLEKIMFQHL